MLTPALAGLFRGVYHLFAVWVLSSSGTSSLLIKKTKNKNTASYFGAKPTNFNPLKKTYKNTTKFILTNKTKLFKCFSLIHIEVFKIISKLTLLQLTFAPNRTVITNHISN